MPQYVYKVRDKVGKVYQGQMEATDDRDLRRKLDERDFFIIDYSQKNSGKDFLSIPVFPAAPSVSFSDLSLINWQLFTLLDAGLTLSNSLRIIISQSKNEAVKSSFSRVYQRVEEGSTFANALKESPKVFSRFYVQMVNAGEVGGVLDEMLKRLAVYYERQAEITSRIKSAMIYPSMLLFMSMAVIGFLVTFVLPQFAGIFKDIGVATPMPTRFLLGISMILRTYWPLVLGATFMIFLVGRIFINTEKGGYQFDRLILKIPLIGDLINKSVIVQFTQTLATLVNSGIPILSALDVVTDTIGNRALTKVLRDVASCVQEGKPMVQPLESSRMFPEMLVSMIRVGEETGSLSKMLEKISEFYYKDVYNAIEAFTKLVEPVLMMFMAGFIGFIAISIFLPMASLLQTIR